jgi:hypothetical protein
MLLRPNSYLRLVIDKFTMHFSGVSSPFSFLGYMIVVLLNFDLSLSSIRELNPRLSINDHSRNHSNG